MTGNGPSLLNPGAALAGRYVVDRHLRNGVLTAVYRVRRDVGPSHDEERFEARVIRLGPSVVDATKAIARELERVAAMSHPAIPKLVEVSVDTPGLVVVTEAPADEVPSRTLRESITGGERMPLRELARILAEVAQALDAMHGLRPPCVHRRLVPENVTLVGTGSVVRLEECGLAHGLVAAGAVTARMPLSPKAYLSPDELLQKPTPRGDIFTLASIAYECLTGQQAFRGSSETSLATSILRGVRPTVRAARPEVPAQVDAVLSRAWSVEGAQGFATAQAFADAFRGAVGNAGATAPRAATPSGGQDPKATLLGQGPVVAPLAAQLRAPGAAAPFTLSATEPAGPRRRERAREVTARVEVPNIHPPGTERIQPNPALPVGTRPRAPSVPPPLPSSGSMSPAKSMPPGTAPVAPPASSTGPDLIVDDRAFEDAWSTLTPEELRPEDMVTPDLEPEPEEPAKPADDDALFGSIPPDEPVNPQLVGGPVRPPRDATPAYGAQSAVVEAPVPSSVAKATRAEASPAPRASSPSSVDANASSHTSTLKGLPSPKEVLAALGAVQPESVARGDATDASHDDAVSYGAPRPPVLRAPTMSSAAWAAPPPGSRDTLEPSVPPPPQPSEPVRPAAPTPVPVLPAPSVDADPLAREIPPVAPVIAPPVIAPPVIASPVIAPPPPVMLPPVVAAPMPPVGLAPVTPMATSLPAVARNDGMTDAELSLRRTRILGGAIVLAALIVTAGQIFLANTRQPDEPPGTVRVRHGVTAPSLRAPSVAPSMAAPSVAAPSVAAPSVAPSVAAPSVAPSAAPSVAAVVADAGAPTEDHPTPRALTQLFDGLVGDMRRCVGGTFEHHLRIGIVYEGATGRATNVTIAGRYGRPPVGACVEDLVRSHPVAPFRDEAYEFHQVYDPDEQDEE